MSTRRLGRVVVAVVVWAGLAGLGGCGKAMAPFAPAEGDFRVVMPGTPKVEVTSSVTPQGPQRIRDYSGRSGRTVYGVTVFERLDGQGGLIDWESPEEGLDDLEGRIVKTGGRVTDQRSLSLNGHPGREYRTDANEDGIVTDFRFFAVGPRLYMLCYEVSKPFYSEARGRAFFDSFALGGSGGAGGSVVASGGTGAGLSAPGASSASAPPSPPVIPRSASAPLVSTNEAAAEVGRIREQQAGRSPGMNPAEIGSVATSAAEAIGPLPDGPDAAIANRGVPARGMAVGPPGVGGGPPGLGGGPPGVGGGPPVFGRAPSGFGPGRGGPGIPGPGIPGPGAGPPGAVPGRVGPTPAIGATRSAAGVGFETEMAGGTGGGTLRAIDPDRPLLGIDFGLGVWDGEKSLGRVTAIFARDQRPAPNSNREIAPEGYAVGGVEVRTIRYVNAIRFRYLRVGPDGRLDPNDRIEGDWIGHPSDQGRVVSLGGDGRTVIGVVCKQGAILDGLALVMDREGG